MATTAPSLQVFFCFGAAQCLHFDSISASKWIRTDSLPDDMPGLSPRLRRLCQVQFGLAHTAGFRIAFAVIAAVECPSFQRGGQHFAGTRLQEQWFVFSRCYPVCSYNAKG